MFVDNPRMCKTQAMTINYNVQLFIVQIIQFQIGLQRMVRECNENQKKCTVRVPVVVKSFQSDFLHLQLPKKIEIRMPAEILPGATVPQPVEEMQAVPRVTEEDQPPTGGSPVLSLHQTPDEATVHELYRPSTSDDQEAGVDSETDAPEVLVSGDHQQAKVISWEELQTHRVSKSRERMEHCCCCCVLNLSLYFSFFPFPLFPSPWK